MLQKINYFADPLFWNEKLGKASAVRIARITAQFNEYVSRENIVHNRQQRLRNLLLHAYVNVPFYRDYFNNLGIHVSDMQTEADLHFIPSITKQSFRVCGPLKSRAQNIHQRRMQEAITSGSTGEPFRFVHDLAYMNEKKILAERVWKRAGTDSSVRKLYCSTESSRNLWPNMIFLHPHYFQSKKREYADIIRTTKPEFLFGYPLTTFELLWTLAQQGIHDIKFKAAVFTGHVTAPGIRKFFKEYFGGKIFAYYGAMELGVIAVECEFNQGFHVQEENIIIDIVDMDGKSVQPGVVGKVVITSLSNEVMPFIRYEVGDLGAFVLGECPCGRTSRRIIVEGRNNESLFVHKNGECIYPGILRDILDDFFPYFHRYQLQQLDLDHFVLTFVSAKSCTADIKTKIIKSIQQVVGRDSIVEINEVAHIIPLPSGKFQYFISPFWERKFPLGMVHTPVLTQGMVIS